MYRFRRVDRGSCSYGQMQAGIGCRLACISLVRTLLLIGAAGMLGSLLAIHRRVGGLRRTFRCRQRRKHGSRCGRKQERQCGGKCESSHEPYSFYRMRTDVWNRASVPSSQRPGATCMPGFRVFENQSHKRRVRALAPHCVSGDCNASVTGNRQTADLPHDSIVGAHRHRTAHLPYSVARTGSSSLGQKNSGLVGARERTID